MMLSFSRMRINSLDSFTRDSFTTEIFRNGKSGIDDSTNKKSLNLLLIFSLTVIHSLAASMAFCMMLSFSRMRINSLDSFTHDCFTTEMYNSCGEYYFLFLALISRTQSIHVRLSTTIVAY